MAAKKQQCLNTIVRAIEGKMRLLFIILFTFLLSDQLQSKEFDGPSSAGPEYFKCGQYRLKGYLFRKNKKSPFLLRLYPKTTREYQIRITGNSLRVYYNKKRPIAISLKVDIVQEGYKTQVLAELIEVEDVIIRTDLYKYSVRMIEARKCPSENR